MSFWPVSFTSRLLVLALISTTAAADGVPWQFGPPQTIAEARPGLFHHLDSAGRRNMAVSGKTVAIAWEDNRDGTPRVYAGFRRGGKEGFAVQRLSGEGEAAEPVVTGVGEGRFIFAWEEKGTVWLRGGDGRTFDPPLRLSQSVAAHVTLARGPRGVYAAWAERHDKVMAIRVAKLMETPAGQVPKLLPAVPVTKLAPADQLYPALSVLKSAVVVAWEDRRDGHTVIYAAHSSDDRSFSDMQRINERGPPRRGISTLGPGARRGGTGAARVVLAPRSAQSVMALWLDKRDFEGGYDIYSAEAAAPGLVFGGNLPVHDEFGKNAGQWHAALAIDGRGRQVCVWDDDRDGSPDLFISWRTTGVWSENLAIPGVGGAGVEASPVLAFDEQNRLHLAWVERSAIDAPTRLRYLRAEPIPAGP